MIMARVLWCNIPDLYMWGDMEFLLVMLYLVCVAVFLCCGVMVRVLILFKLDRVNKKLEEIKELLSERSVTKKLKKQWGSGVLKGGLKRRIMYIMYSLSCWRM